MGWLQMDRVGQDDKVYLYLYLGFIDMYGINGQV